MWCRLDSKWVIDMRTKFVYRNLLFSLLNYRASVPYDKLPATLPTKNHDENNKKSKLLLNF